MEAATPRSDDDCAPELPEHVEARLVAIHFDVPPDGRAAAFAQLVAEHPEHDAVLRATWRRLTAGEALAEDLRAGVATAATPDRIGGFSIVRELGRGGMGIVYLAEQREPVRRRVALKLVQGFVPSERMLRRFENERQALASMDHEHIARVYEAGATPDGLPWIAMEFVDGAPITAACDARRLDLRARLELFVQVCSAVQHAHGRGVLHRDLKPSNVLVVGRGEVLVPKVIDFGLARATHPDPAEEPLHTRDGVALGTPGYAAPEQERGDVTAVDVRADVYSLGAVLHELVVGRLPERRPDGTATAPSLRSDVADAARRRWLRGDLDWIVLRALEPEPAERYATVDALERDVRRYLADEPIDAGPPTTAYRVRKFVRRHRAGVTFAALLLLSLLAGGIAAALGWTEAEHRATDARIAGEGERRARRDAERHLARFDLLASVIELEDAIAGAAALGPERPERAAGMRAWLRDAAEPLLARRDAVHAALAELAGATDTRETFLRGALSELDADLDRFFDPERGVHARVADSAQWCERVDGETVAAHAAAWAAAIDAIRASDDARASARYAGLRIEPQVGLVPVGMDPESKLWEFAFPRSGTIPVRDPESGSLRIDGDSAIVFVLLPAGTTEIGVQDTRPDAPRYTPGASPSKLGVRTVALDAFFLAKFETTQAQWLRLTLDNPSRYSVGKWFEQTADGVRRITGLHPVESVTHVDASRVLAWLDLALPTGVQWEYGCDGGRGTRWWTGADRESLRGRANLADRSAGVRGFASPEAVRDWPELDDGWPAHAPVDAFPGNEFGLHQMAGNVMEWCADSYSRDAALRPGDGLCDRESKDAVVRGGGFLSTARELGTWYFGWAARHNGWPDVGVRPVRPLRAR